MLLELVSSDIDMINVKYIINYGRYYQFIRKKQALPRCSKSTHRKLIHGAICITYKVLYV
jgi:hypothetical protein